VVEIKLPKKFDTVEIGIRRNRSKYETVMMEFYIGPLSFWLTDRKVD